MNYIAAERHESWDHKYDIYFIKYDYQVKIKMSAFEIFFNIFNDFAKKGTQIQGITKETSLDSIWPKLQENIYSLENGHLCKKGYSKLRLLSLHYGGILAISGRIRHFITIIFVKLVVRIFVYNISIFVQISRSCVGFFLLGTWNRNFSRSTPKSQNGAKNVSIK